MDRKSGLLSNIDFLFNQPTIETYCNNAGNIILSICTYQCPDHVILTGRQMTTGHQMTNLVSNFEYLLLICFLTRFFRFDSFRTTAILYFLSYMKVSNLHNAYHKISFRA